MLLREAETDITQRAKGDVLDGPRVVRDPAHVTVRNLGELSHAREGNPGRLMKAIAER